MDPVGEITVERSPSDWASRFRRYKVWVDGKQVGSLKRGERITVQAGVGVRMIRCTIDWTGSPSVNVQVVPDQTTRVIVSAAGFRGSARGMLDGQSFLELDIEHPQG